MPVRVVLRYTNTESPNLADVAYQFEYTQAEAVKAARRAEEVDYASYH